jgi:hypothetical protein
MVQAVYWKANSYSTGRKVVTKIIIMFVVQNLICLSTVIHPKVFHEPLPRSEKNDTKKAYVIKI